jgi:hypothetical protein
MNIAILFPSSVFSRFEVDSDFQKEYDAAFVTGYFRIIFYDYEHFVRTGELLLARCPDEEMTVIYRGWMLNAVQYESFYRQLEKRSLHLVTSPSQYCMMHLFPNVYPLLAEDTPKILVFPEGTSINIEEIKHNFTRFMIKDFVKSEKGTDFPKFFSSSISESEFERYVATFREYRGKLFTGGICIKEFVDLQKYNEHTNEWRVFYAKGKILSVSRNSGQGEFPPAPPKPLLKKYASLPSSFYTVDYAELASGDWKILEVGDGQVSGLSDGQNAESFFRGLSVLFVE